MDEMWSDMEEPVREVEAPPSPEQVAPRPARYGQSVMFEEELGGVNTEGQRAQKSSRDRDRGRAAVAADMAMGDGRRSDGGEGDEATAKSVDTEDSRATDESADADAGAGGGGRKRRYRPLIDRAGELVEARASGGGERGVSRAVGARRRDHRGRHGGDG
jgi:hypothetical protein